jgi:hypothetical protein
MIAWLLVQKNPETNEINQTIVTETVANVEDYAVRSGSWKDCPIEIIGVTINALDPTFAHHLTQLENRSYRSDGWIDNEEAALQQLCQRYTP